MDLKAVINDEAPGKDDESIMHYIQQLVTEFLKSSKERFSFYLENLLSFFSEGSLYDILKAAFKIKEDEKEHFLPLARKCDPEVRDFFYGLFKKPRPKRKKGSNVVPIDAEIENKAKDAALDLVYEHLKSLEITGFCFLEESDDGLVVKSRLMPDGRWVIDKNEK